MVQDKRLIIFIQVKSINISHLNILANVVGIQAICDGKTHASVFWLVKEYTVEPIVMQRQVEISDGRSIYMYYIIV